MKRIFILGISGSGKSYLAEKLSQKLNIEKFDLDDIFWEAKYAKKRDIDVCKKILNKKVDLQKEWIYEGIYNDWTEKIIKESNLIVFLDFSKNLLSYRIFLRWLKRRKKTKEPFLDMLSLIKFQRNYKKIRKEKEESFFDAHKRIIESHEEKTIIIKNKKEFNEFLKKI